MKVLFLPRLCACCQETLTNTLTWAGRTGAYQQVANRNQSSAFRSLSRDWDNGVDGREGNRGKEKTGHGGEECVPSGHCVSQSTYHERGTLLSHLGHSRADVKRKGSCPSRRLLVTLMAGAELCVEEMASSAEPRVKVNKESLTLLRTGLGSSGTWPQNDKDFSSECCRKPWLFPFDLVWVLWCPTQSRALHVPGPLRLGFVTNL